MAMSAAEFRPDALLLDASGPWLRLLGRCAIRAGLLGKSPRMVFFGRHSAMSAYDGVDASLARHLADSLAAVPDFPGRHH